MSEPSLADLGAFPQWLLPYRLGLCWPYAFLEFPAILSWMTCNVLKRRTGKIHYWYPRMIRFDPFQSGETIIDGKR
ncbi:MAG: hypothetical protein R3F37_15205 [Candidatus Competibacteraceae bacterium]